MHCCSNFVFKFITITVRINSSILSFTYIGLTIVTKGEYIIDLCLFEICNLIPNITFHNILLITLFYINCELHIFCYICSLWKNLYSDEWIIVWSAIYNLNMFFFFLIITSLWQIKLFMLNFWFSLLICICIINWYYIHTVFYHRYYLPCTQMQIRIYDINFSLFLKRICR